MTSVSITRASRFISVSLASDKQNEPGKKTGKKRKPNQWWMPNKTIETERPNDPVDHQKQGNRCEEIEEYRGRKCAENGKFTQHREAPSCLTERGTGRICNPAGRP